MQLSHKSFLYLRWLCNKDVHLDYLSALKKNMDRRRTWPVGTRRPHNFFVTQDRPKATFALGVLSIYYSVGPRPAPLTWDLSNGGNAQMSPPSSRRHDHDQTKAALCLPLSVCVKGGCMGGAGGGGRLCVRVRVYQPWPIYCCRGWVGSWEIFLQQPHPSRPPVCVCVCVCVCEVCECVCVWPSAAYQGGDLPFAGNRYGTRSRVSSGLLRSL